jgi:Uma2 family endonuclease
MSLMTLTMPATMAVPFASPGVHRITVDEYERIISAGALNDPDRVELIDGYMVDKLGKSAEHGYTTKKAIKALEALLPPGWTWRSGQPVRIPDFDEPEPDVTIVRGTDEDYEHRIPNPADVGLLIEVSLTTLDQDRGKKLSSYATSGIPVYWIINLVERQVEVYTGPGPNAYRSRVDYRPGEFVPIVIGGQQLGQIAVDQVLPTQPATPTADGKGA